MIKNNTSKAFTLIELLVVIAIISLLSSVVLASLGGAREEARETAAAAELNSLRTGIEMLINDTGKWPNGCPPSGGTANPEVNLNNSSAGLLSQPSVGNQGSGCQWTSRDVQRWNGPYVNSSELIDPWDNPYYFDPDYPAYSGCDSKETEPTTVAILSIGPDGGLNQYGCNDIFISLD